MHPISIHQIWFHLEPRLISIGVTVSAIVIGVGLYWIANKLLNRVSKNFQNKYFKLFQKYWQKPLLIVFVLALLGIIHPIIEVFHKEIEVYDHIIALLTIGLITWIIIQTIYTLRDLAVGDGYVAWARDSFSAKRLFTKVNILVKILIVTLIIIGVSLALMTFPKVREVGISVLTTGGIVVIILGFAAQKILGNILAGIQIAFTQPMRIGDEIIVENEWGVVEEITLTYVVIRVWDKRRLIVPINYFIENIFQNWTLESADLLGVIYLEVDYVVPLQALRDALDRILSETKLWDGKVKVLQVTDAKAQSVQLRILASSASAGESWDLRCYVREKLIEFLQKNYPDSLPKVRLSMREAEASVR